MRAARFTEYGGPVRIQDVADPRPAPGEVLIRVEAAALNPLDWHEVRGEPRLMRLSSGLRRPRRTGIGADVAGVVVAVGDGVTRCAPGDAVVGHGSGTAAELVVVAERGVVRRPEGLGAVDAAALPVAGQTAWQALHDVGGLGEGDRVLVLGSSGGVGTLAVQLAKLAGAHVTGTCSGRNVDLVHSLGADEVVDYTREAPSGRYDLVLDAVGAMPLGLLVGLLDREGRAVLVGAGTGRVVGPMLRIARASVRRTLRQGDLRACLARRNAAQIEALASLVAEGRLRAVIDRVLPLGDAADALAHVESGRARGKVVLSVPG